MKNIILYILLATLAFSCTERIELDLNTQESQRLIVDAWVVDQPGESYVRLSLTTDYFLQEAPPAAVGANVTVNDGTTTYQFLEQGPGNYIPPSGFIGETGKSYTLDISYGGKEHTATTVLRPIAPIDSIYVFPSEDPEFPDGYAVYLFVQEPLGLGDFYMWRYHQNGTLVTDTLNEWVTESDEFIDGNYINGFPIFEFEATSGDRIMLEQQSISKEGNDYIISILEETEFRGGPFDPPPANIPTNISNGALGFFHASARVTAEAIVF